jgi:micrococcal nuclease
MGKKTLLFLTCFVLWAGIARAGELYTLETIKKVIDGDTFELESGKKIHLIGVDAPEVEDNRKAREDAERTGQSVDQIIARGKAALEWVAHRLEGKKIFLKYDKKRKDRYGIEQVYAFLYDEALFYGGIVQRERFNDVQFNWWEPKERARYLFINATIIRGGYANTENDPPNLEYADEFDRLFWEAEEAAEGLWNVNYFEVPCVKEGGKIGVSAGQVVRCCGEAMPIFPQKVNGKCQDKPVVGSGGYCSHCGNNTCESQYLEDPCNCPEDCR